MRGSIRVKERGKRYEVRVSLGRDPVTGRYRQKSVSVRGSRAEAERVLRRLIDEVEVQETTEPGGPVIGTAATSHPRVMFGELLDEWLSFKDTAGGSAPARTVGGRALCRCVGFR